uniref:Uncharacterized protein n=1 Tax=Oryza brachyantha TaxID=4533 RepID=J3LCY3_ORYBR
MAVGCSQPRTVSVSVAITQNARQLGVGVPRPHQKGHVTAGGYEVAACSDAMNAQARTSASILPVSPKPTGYGRAPNDGCQCHSTMWSGHCFIESDMIPSRDVFNDFRSWSPLIGDIVTILGGTLVMPVRGTHRLKYMLSLRFVADCAHRSYKPILSKANKAKGKSSTSARPSSSQIPERSSSGSLSPFKKTLSVIFGICKKTAVKLLRESGHEIPSESEDEAYEDPFAAYEAARTIVRDVGASSSRPAPVDSDVDTEEEEYVEEDDEESEVPAAESSEEAESDEGEAADDEEGDAHAEGEPEQHAEQLPEQAAPEPQVLGGHSTQQEFVFGAPQMEETAQPEVDVEAEATESDGIQTGQHCEHRLWRH